MTWDDLQEAMERDGVEVRDNAHFTGLIAHLPDAQKQRAWADYRANWAAACRGWTLGGWQRQKRKGVKGERRSYTDASYATEEAAT